MDLAGLQVVVLDLDDTVFLERDYVRSGFNAVSAHLEETLGVAGFGDLAWEQFEQGVRGNVFDVVLTQFDRKPTPEVVAELVEVYRSHAPAITLLPDAAAFVSRQPRSALAVLSDGPLPSQQAKVDALGAESWTRLYLLTEVLGAQYRKPSPLAFQLIEQAFDVRSRSLAYVADNPLKDFIGPASLGWHTVRIRRELGLHRDLLSGPEVEHEIDTLDQLVW